MSRSFRDRLAATVVAEPKPMADRADLERRIDRRRQKRRIGVGVTALVIFAVAGSFSWRVFDADRTGALASASEQPLPTVVDVTCTGGATQVTPEASVTDHGIRFRVANNDNMDEVVIYGADKQGSADIDLSSSTDYTFDQLPPGSYLVGCFTDQNTPHFGTQDNFQDTPGIVPLLVKDPNGFYVDGTLTCSAGENHDDQAYGPQSGDLTSPSQQVRNVVSGLEPTDTVQRTGYVGTPERNLLTARIVRGGSTIGRVRILIGPITALGTGTYVEMDSCQGSGLALQPSPS